MFYFLWSSLGIQKFKCKIEITMGSFFKGPCHHDVGWSYPSWKNLPCSVYEIPCAAPSGRYAPGAAIWRQEPQWIYWHLCHHPKSQPQEAKWLGQIYCSLVWVQDIDNMHCPRGRNPGADKKSWALASFSRSYDAVLYPASCLKKGDCMTHKAEYLV